VFDQPLSFDARSPENTHKYLHKPYIARKRSAWHTVPLLTECLAYSATADSDSMGLSLLVVFEIHAKML